MDGYDIFISHVSEDKDAVARPLAEFLQNLGVVVWFDEFTLDIGDSLSRSVDEGLASSRFGVVILSRSFFSKGWPRHELSGLASKEIAFGKTILPIWHEISADEVRSASPTLADKLAIATRSARIEEIGLKILKVVKPDIFNQLHRWLVWRSTIAKAEHRSVPIDSINLGPIRHPSLPESLLIRIRLIYEVLREAGPLNLDKMITNFRRDIEPARDVGNWERIAASYLLLSRRHALTDSQKRDSFSELLGISLLDRQGAERLIESGSWLAVEAMSAWLDVVSSVDAGYEAKTRKRPRKK